LLWAIKALTLQHWQLSFQNDIFHLRILVVAASILLNRPRGYNVEVPRVGRPHRLPSLSFYLLRELISRDIPAAFRMLSVETSLSRRTLSLGFGHVDERQSCREYGEDRTSEREKFMLEIDPVLRRSHGFMSVTQLTTSRVVYVMLYQNRLIL